MAGRRRVVEKHFINGKPYWEIQVKGLFGWKNQFPAYGGFPETIYYSKEEAQEKARDLAFTSGMDEATTKLEVERVRCEPCQEQETTKKTKKGNNK